MTAKEYLKSLRGIDSAIKRLQERINEERERACSLKSPEMKGRIQASPSGGAAFEHKVIRADEKTAVYERERNSYVASWNRIVGEIESLEDYRHVDVLFKRYVRFMDFQDIAEDMGYSLSRIFELHRTALTAFERKFLQSP